MATMRWLRWFIGLIVLASTNCFNCPEDTGCSNCFRKRNEFEFNCITSKISSFTFTFTPYKAIEIICQNSTNWADFHLEKIEYIEDVETLSFLWCQLPNALLLNSFVQQLQLTSLEELNFQHNFEKFQLNRTSLSHFMGIKKLKLSENILINLPSDLFHDFVNLTIIDLFNNAIEDLPMNFFITPNIKTIVLGKNKIEKIKSGTFGNIGKLNYLSLWENKIREIEEHAFDKLTSLQELLLQSNMLESLHENTFAGLINLDTLCLSFNNFSIDGLPQNLLQKNKNIKKIELSSNKRDITTLPNKFFNNLVNLAEINMDKNGFVSLPENLFIETTGLITLSLSQNSLTTLPKKIFYDCENLASIQLKFNEITHLPKGIFLKQKNLLLLNLAGNNFETITDGVFDGLTNLKELNMEHNKLKIIQSNNFGEMINLRVVKFSYNQLTLKNSESFLETVEGYSPFRHNLAITDLLLAHNNITEIFNDWIMAVDLQHLDLSFNKLETLSDIDLQFLANNLNVDLTHNEIKNVSFTKSLEMINNISPISKNTYQRINVNVFIENNPIACDCSIYDLLRHIEGINKHIQFHIVTDNLTCQTPKRLEHVFVKSLHSTSLTCLANEIGISNEICPSNCDCWMRPDDHVFIIDCSYRNLINAPESITSPNDYHQIEINLTGNNLTTMPSMLQDGYKQVTILILSNNSISSIPLVSLSNNIKVLHIDNNNLSTIDQNVSKFFEESNNLTELKLDKNPWNCDCNGRELFNLIQLKKDKFTELLNVTCGFNNVAIFTMTPNELCPTNTLWIFIISSIVGIFVGSVIFFIYCYFRREIIIWLYSKQLCLCWVTENDFDREKLYDAFLSYSHKDNDFVDNELVPELEHGSRRYKLCLHYRDWYVGDYIIDQVTNSVENSKRTIVILSANYLESVWGKMEFRTAYQNAIQEGKTKIIVIIYGDIPDIDQLDPVLRSYLKTNTYVKWGDPWFWKKLHYAMPHSVHKSKKNTYVV